MEKSAQNFIVFQKYNNCYYQSFKGDFKKFSNRTPKKVSALTSRDQLKTMVSDLEKEVSEILTYMKTSENEKIKLEEELRKAKISSELQKALKELQELNSRFESTKKDLDDEKNKRTKVTQKNEELSAEMNKIRESLERATSEKKKLKEQVDKMNKDQKKALDDNKELDGQLSRLKDQLSKFKTALNLSSQKLFLYFQRV